MTVVNIPANTLPAYQPPEPDWSELWPEVFWHSRAAEIWHATIADLLEAGTLAQAQAVQVRRYVWFQIAFEQAADELANTGGPVKAAKGAPGGLSHNPWWTIASQASQKAADHEAELGLNPRRRGSVTPAKKKARGGAADAYLTQRKA